MTSKEMIKFLLKNGFIEIPGGKGSHRRFLNQSTGKLTQVNSFFKKQCNLKNKSSNPYFQFKMVAVSMAYSFFSFKEKYPNFLILRYFFHFFHHSIFLSYYFFLDFILPNFYFLSFFIFCFPKANCNIFSPIF